MGSHNLFQIPEMPAQPQVVLSPAQAPAPAPAAPRVTAPAPSNAGPLPQSVPMLPTAPAAVPVMRNAAAGAPAPTRPVAPAAGPGVMPPPRAAAPMTPQMPAPERAAPAYSLDEQYDTNRPAGGLNADAEFSTGYGFRPVYHEDLPLIPDGHGGRAKLAVMLAVVALLIVGVVGTAMVFAAGR